MAKKFTRTIEDFTCEYCGASVVGDGYTNHCPKCLWSKHVDVNPGDRVGQCGGMMEPCGGEKKGKSYMVTHRCIACGLERKNSLSDGDDFDTFVSILTTEYLRSGASEVNGGRGKRAGE